MTTTSGDIRFCPMCGSAAVDFSALSGGEARCRACSWHGRVEDLLAVPVRHSFLTDEGMMRELMNELRGLLSGELGLPYLKFLLRWGFITGDIKDLAKTIDRKVLGRYYAKIAHSILCALLEERAKIAEETARKQMGAN